MHTKKRKFGAIVWIITDDQGIAQGVIDALLEDGAIAVCNTDKLIGRYVESGDYFFSVKDAKKEAIKRIRENAKEQIEFIKNQYK